MEIRQLRYFVAVADAGNFVHAAERLHIGQPAVSQQVARLERGLGVRLFERSTRHVRLTTAGERLLPEAWAVLAAADRVRAVAAGVASGTDAVLRLGSSHGLGDRLFQVLDELATLAPGVTVRLTRSRQEDRLAAVRSGELDAAFVKVVESAPGLELLPVWRGPLVVALPERHPLAAQDTVCLKQLGELPVRLAPVLNNPPFHRLITAALRAAGVDPPAGPPFTTLQDTLAEIGTGSPSRTVLPSRGAPRRANASRCDRSPTSRCSPRWSRRPASRPAGAAAPRCLRPGLRRRDALTFRGVGPDTCGAVAGGRRRHRPGCAVS